MQTFVFSGFFVENSRSGSFVFRSKKSKPPAKFGIEPQKNLGGFQIKKPESQVKYHDFDENVQKSLKAAKTSLTRS